MAEETHESEASVHVQKTDIPVFKMKDAIKRNVKKCSEMLKKYGTFSVNIHIRCPTVSTV